MLSMMALTQKAFGPSPRCSVCAIGFEPNEVHRDAYGQTVAALTAVGFGAHVFPAAAALRDGRQELTVSPEAPLSASLQARHDKEKKDFMQKLNEAMDSGDDDAADSVNSTWKDARGRWKKEAEDMEKTEKGVYPYGKRRA